MSKIDVAEESQVERFFEEAQEVSFSLGHLELKDVEGMANGEGSLFAFFGNNEAML